MRRVPTSGARWRFVAIPALGAAGVVVVAVIATMSWAGGQSAGEAQVKADKAATGQQASEPKVAEVREPDEATKAMIAIAMGYDPATDDAVTTDDAAGQSSLDTQPLMTMSDFDANLSSTGQGVSIVGSR